MSAITNVDQQLIENSSMVIQQEAVQREMKYQCQQCDFKTTSRGSLFNHHESVHVGRRFKFEECANQFIHKGDLTVHPKSLHMHMGGTQ